MKPMPPGIAAARRAAAFTSRMPAPHWKLVEQLLPTWKARAVEVSIVRTSVAVSAGFADSISDTAPATCGAAKLVPLAKKAIYGAPCLVMSVGSGQF